MSDPIGKYFYPPRPGSGGGTFSDDIVGLQTVSGGGLTGGNFEFTSNVLERVVRTFSIGSFNEPITLDKLNILNEQQNRVFLSNEVRIYPNYDISQVLNFSLYGSLSKRFSVSVTKIINYFPASIDVEQFNINLLSGYTAENISYDSVNDETYFEVNVNRFFNPFGIDYSVNSKNNITYSEIAISRYRDISSTYLDYCIDINDNIYKVLSFSPSESLLSGSLAFYVQGNPFSGASQTILPYKIRPNDYVVDRIFKDSFDEIEQYLLNRLIDPIYTAIFQIPEQNDYGQFYLDKRQVTWPREGSWNLDIRTPAFDTYLEELQNVADIMDSFKTNLISRFLVSDSLKEFDTLGRKVESILQIYGRSFDEIKKFIDGIAYVNSVNYNPSNDIPSQLLVNLAKTLGWDTNISPITNESFLDSIFGNTTDVTYPGYARAQTPNELNFAFYRNLIINSAYLFRSKGTRRSIEFLLRLIGAPDPLIEFNEYIYLADQKINIEDFNSKYAKISGGTYVIQEPVYQTDVTFKIRGTTFTGFTTRNFYQSINIEKSDYPLDSEGYPSTPRNTDLFYFQKGAGWYQSTPEHRSPDLVTLNGQVYTGQNIDIQTSLEPFTYGQKYLDRFIKFPYMNEGFKLTKTIDNKKSWVYSNNKNRISVDGGYDAYYYTDDERLVLNSKNVDIFINPSIGLVYDVWDESVRYDYPIPNTGLTSPYPQIGGVDWTYINPKPKNKSFFEFAQTFWKNMINVRNRMYITDGKTGGYPTLDSIFWKYIESEETTGIPNNKYTYQKIIEYVQGLNQYWVNLIEQMVPATTLWKTGLKFENSIFHRQKFAYRRQRGCQLLKVPKSDEIIIGNVFDFNCGKSQVSFDLYPWQNSGGFVSNLKSMLADRINHMRSDLGLNDKNCLYETVRTTWYTDLKIGNIQIVKFPFYYGYGSEDAPNDYSWLYGVTSGFPQMKEYGYDYYIYNGIVTLYSPDCYLNDNKVTLSVGLDIKISC